MSAAAIVSAAFVAGFAPEPEITVSQWADRYRIVGKPSPEPGEWHTSRVPYAREIMDELSPSSETEIVVLEKAAQGAGSEIGINGLACWAHRYPDSALVVLPTSGAAKKWVRTRLDPVIEINPELKAIFAPQRSRGKSNTVSMKELVSGDKIIVCGANSGVDLRSYPSRYAVLDEVDGYPFDLDHEGDPTELALQRTAAYRNRKVFMLSTPTLLQSSRIHSWFLKGDQRLFHIPCPLCDHVQHLRFNLEDEEAPGGLRWPAGRPDLAAYQCERCGDSFEEWRKIDALARGEWIHTAPGNGWHERVRSYQINALYYPYGWPGNAWAKLAAKWENEKRDPVKRKSFINLKAGLPYSDPTEAKADADTLIARCEAYGPELALGVAVLTIGGDVQANRIEVELVGWGANEESWSVDYKRFMGDTTKPEVWLDLDDWLRSQYMNEAGLPFSIRAGCIDARYQREVVRKFCTERQSRRIWAIHGYEGNKPVWPSKVKRQRSVAAPVYNVGVDACKEILYSRLKIQNPGPGYCHFPNSLEHGRDYFEMLTAEVRIPDYTGPLPRFKWQKKTAGARNEALDCRNYAYAALVGLILTTGLRLNQEAARVQRMSEAEARPIAERPVPSPAALAWRPKLAYASDPYLE